MDKFTSQWIARVLKRLATFTAEISTMKVKVGKSRKMSGPRFQRVVLKEVWIRQAQLEPPEALFGAF